MWNLLFHFTQKILDALKSEKPTVYDKVVSLIDRIEFIRHLEYVKKEAAENRYMLAGHEVIGIDNDIDALRVYLSITCIDIVAKMTPFSPFDKWIINNCDDYDNTVPIKKYLETKSYDHLLLEGVSSNFKNAFMKSSDQIRNSLVENITVFDGTNSSSEIDKIVDFFKAIRNKYTHEGLRVYYPSTIVGSCRIIIGVRYSCNTNELENRSRRYIDVNNNFNLIEALQLVAKEKIKSEVFL